MSVVSRGVIRRAERGDLERVLEIERDSFPTPRSEAALRYDLRRELFLVYEEGDAVVGYLIVDVESSPPWLSVFEGEAYGHVLDLAVDRDYRGRGIGEALMRRGLEALSGSAAEKVKLEVRVGNEAAMGLYRKLGFEVVQKLRSYYSNGDDAWLMVRGLE